MPGRFQLRWYQELAHQGLECAKQQTRHACPSLLRSSNWPNSLDRRLPLSILFVGILLLLVGGIGARCVLRGGVLLCSIGVREQLFDLGLQGRKMILQSCCGLLAACEILESLAEVSYMRSPSGHGGHTCAKSASTDAACESPFCWPTMVIEADPKLAIEEWCGGDGGAGRVTRSPCGPCAFLLITPGRRYPASCML
jgi:hypothetical protein